VVRGRQATARTQARQRSPAEGALFAAPQDHARMAGGAASPQDAGGFAA